MPRVNHGEEWIRKITQAVKASDYYIKQKAIEEEKIRNYNINPKTCLYCRAIIPYKKRANKFCSRRCSGFVATKGHKLTEATKAKISDSIKKSEKYKEKQRVRLLNLYKKDEFGKCESKVSEKTCPICLKTFYSYNKHKIFCSRNCHKYDARNGYKYCRCAVGGHYQEGSGRGKFGWYKGVFCNSTYELAWVIFNLEHDIPFIRNRESFDYIFNGKKHKYYPDFIQNDTYIEIKGFLRENDKFKFEQFPKKLIVLFKKDIQEHLDYCKQKYGCRLERLYEQKIPAPRLELGIQQ